MVGSPFREGRDDSVGIVTVPGVEITLCNLGGRAGYPDFSVELVSMGETGGGLVAFQWVVRGTNTGPGLDGTPPTARALTLPGATFLQVEGDKIRSEHVYHDRQTIAEQLGLKATKD